jgi:hypothetical protein
MTADELHACWTFIADAVECVAQPRACEPCGVDAEAGFIGEVTQLLYDAQCPVPRDALGARLLGAWQRLQCSGVLQRRNIEYSTKHDDDIRNATMKAADAAAVAPGLRRCGLASCSTRELHPDHFKTCAACRKVAYCCKEHQAEHWPDHKAACKAARKKAADADDGAGPSGA